MKKLHDDTEVSDNTPTHLVNGERHLLSAEDQADADARAAAGAVRKAAYNAAAPARKIEAIRAEADRRHEAGTIINGSPFKCDTASIAALTGMVTAGGRKPTKTWTFTTAAGVKQTVNKAEAEAIFDAVDDFVSAVREVSADAQELVAGMTPAAADAFDPVNDVPWP